ncbi:relaxase/mobilization nuclease domain-containing protein [Rhizobium leguminosarum]|uniref:relaxase/mobilization nuclease domain-containing protein n=1 Tax=Rhizobium leguminosarum TaxID=384 RepID=UPI001441BEBE|nr:relaxase/mobilization nuclease domain-containing protein [Rhizobium leguminosarum]NKK43480.1 relaxase/mobilization nuclease domain-containing protein [Rhizobium leguminosarum bv. viciae]
MIVQTTRISRKGGVRGLARHLLDKLTENEAIEVLAGDRHALFDAHALASVKGCRYSIRHLSVSPEREMTPAQLSEFLRSVDAEFRIGADRPRLVVRHVKKGRSHFHIAVAEVDPTTLRVLDCRNDFARLEDLARRYEQSHNETIQPTRAERRQRRVEGFSDVARKRAERATPKFDRTKLKLAFAASGKAFIRELALQGLQIANGDKGPVLVTATGTFVAAANRAVAVRRGEFLKIMEEMKHDGNYFRVDANPDVSRTEHRNAPASPVAPGDAGQPGSHRAAHGPAESHPRRSAPAGPRAECGRRAARSSIASIAWRLRTEQLFLRRLGKLDLDDLLRRAEELAAWMRSIFEPPAQRLTRKIRELKQEHKTIVPAEISTPAPATYDFQGRMRP